ncbi:MAG: methionine synthase II (cobalamin-independent) [Verrucomicrobiales bacterium]|jgi:methionine synthase II (cobalamin-independent)
MDKEKAEEVVKEMNAYLSQFKEMSHRAQSRIVKLAELSFVIEDNLKQKEYADRVTELFSISTNFEDKLEALIHDYEIERNRIENEAG